MALLCLLFLLIHTFLQSTTMVVLANHQDEEAETFMRECPPSKCSERGPEIRFPFRLSSLPKHCGHGDLVLSCSGNDTILTLPYSGPYTVTAINYANYVIAVIDNSWVGCPWPNITAPNLINSPFVVYPYNENARPVWFNCSRRIDLPVYGIIGPVPCHPSSTRSFIYVAVDTTPDNTLLNCTVFARSSFFGSWGYWWRDHDLSKVPEVLLQWNEDDISSYCIFCERNGTECGFNQFRNETFCIAHRHGFRGARIMMIAGLSFGLLIIIVLGGLAYFYISLQLKMAKARKKVEQFLRAYKAANPTRYTFDEIRKITNRFKQKLGQGGFGTVYKGQLSNGIPVAVKMLGSYGGNGVEFINEVSTIGRIHHVNVVRLLGFCSEGARHALIYEFMPNGSLEKYIFSKERGRNSRHKFSMEELENLAIGIAEGIEYLHQGCDQRILHFDIKPHNILLDHNFTPKISDFGLSKLCPKDQSYVTISAARGTMGYVAPEMYSRNFGTVSYKSDVYSFGMLIIEMISKRKNVDPLRGSQSQVYLPEWIYDQILDGEETPLLMEIDYNNEITKRLAIVALWCIQLSPADRPSMTRVVQMLRKDLQSLRIPPKPFISSSSQTANGEDD